MTCLLLHACCAPCSLEPMRLLTEEGFEPTICWTNPNIQPADEHDRRLVELRRWCAGNGIPLIDLGAKPASTDPIVSIDSTTGETSLYAVCLGMEHIHGVSMAGQPPLRSWLPKFEEAGAVKTGEVEMVAAIAIKQTRSAAVLRKIKVSPAGA